MLGVAWHENERETGRKAGEEKGKAVACMQAGSVWQRCVCSRREAQKGHGSLGGGERRKRSCQGQKCPCPNQSPTVEKREET